MAALGGTMGPVRLQLPPQLRFDPDRLAQFCRNCRRDIGLPWSSAIPGWYVDATFGLLGKHDVAPMLSDHRPAPGPWVRTASFVYIRGHGPVGDYRGAYSEAALANWTAKIAGRRTAGCDAHANLDNDIGGAAPSKAQGLRALGKEILSEQPSKFGSVLRTWRPEARSAAYVWEPTIEA